MSKYAKFTLLTLAAFLLLGFTITVNAAKPVPTGAVTITDCQVISESGSYEVGADLLAEIDSGCIIITVDNVTLDLMGFNIVGNDLDTPSELETGILISNEGVALSNVEVRNGTVRNFGNNGISAPDGLNQGHRIINVRAMNNLDSGIFLNGLGMLVKDCTAVNNGDATSSNNEGIHVNTGGATITGNIALDNARHGIEASSGSTVTGNTANFNGISGIHGDGSGLMITGNTAAYNSLGISGAASGAIIGNTVIRNGTGISPLAGALVKGNMITQNEYVGISLNVQFVVVEENTISGHKKVNPNTGIGIALRSGSSGNFCDNNRFADNFENLYDDSSPGVNDACTSNTGF